MKTLYRQFNKFFCYLNAYLEHIGNILHPNLNLLFTTKMNDKIHKNNSNFKKSD